MNSKGIRLFICYQSGDSSQVDTIVSRLASLKKADGTPQFLPWQDKADIPAGKDWWEAIVDAIVHCRVFVFFISQEALKNDLCLAELRYAQERNRPIVPIVLQGEYEFNTRTGQNDLTYRDKIPSELKETRTQFLFYEGLAFYKDFKKALVEFGREPQKWRDLKRPRPRDPRPASEDQIDSPKLYSEACDYAGRLEFETARLLFRKLIHQTDNDFEAPALGWIDLLNQYERLLLYDSQAHTKPLIPNAWRTYKEQFPIDFIDGIFDPRGFGARINNSGPTPQPTKRPLLPEPFAWIVIPAGKVKIVSQKGAAANYVPAEQAQTFNVPVFSMSKYPITNSQYAVFVDAGGYREPRWWTSIGWEARERGMAWDVTSNAMQPTGRPWIEPRFWHEAPWNNPDHPVVGISWYEGVAFCQWLSETKNEKISLPTEQQWQRAAQGGKGLLYPWGNDWDVTRCNSGAAHLKQTTPVYQYEGKGSSPDGVVDMIGNVWEWCLTSYKDGVQDIKFNAERRVLRGGSWNTNNIENLRADYRFRDAPDNWINVRGFRCVRT